MRSKYINLIIGFVITCISFWILFKSISYDELTEALSAPNYWWLIPNLCFGFLALWSQALRWRTLISPLKKISTYKVFSAASIGLMFNNILPFRLGEYVRVFILSHQESNLSKEPLFLTVLVERLIFDLGALALVILGVFCFIPLYQQIEFGIITTIFTGVIAVIIIFIIFMTISSQNTIKVVSRLLFFISYERQHSFKKALKRFASTLHLLKSNAIIIKGIILTILIWISMTLSTYCLFKSFSFQLPFTASFVLLATVGLAMFIPSLPGYIGVFHLATVVTLTNYNIAGVDARAFSIVFHLSQYIPTTILGLFFLIRTKISFNMIKKKTMQKQSQ